MAISTNTALTFSTYAPLPTIVETIQLKGQRELYVTLQGQRELYVTLQGGVMTAENQNLRLYASESRIITIPAVKEDGVSPLDLTGATIKYAVKRKIGAATSEVYKDTTSGTVTITDAANGKVTVELTSDDTQPLAGDYDHVAVSIDAIGKESVLMHGTITIKPLTI